MATPTLFRGWLRYNMLDNPCSYLTASFALGYRFRGETEDDVWSGRFNGVKFNTTDPRYFNAAVAMMNSALPTLLNGLRFSTRDVLFTAALGSTEINGQKESVMQRIAVATSRNVGSQFSEQILTKQPHPQLHISPSAQARQEIMKGANYQSALMSTLALCSSLMTS